MESSEELQRQVSEGIKLGKETADAVKAAGKAAAKLAEQNYAGAAITAIKESRILRIVLVCTVLLPAFVLYSIFAFPVVIYENLAAYYQEIGENFAEYYDELCLRVSAYMDKSELTASAARLSLIYVIPFYLAEDAGAAAWKGMKELYHDLIGTQQTIWKKITGRFALLSGDAEDEVFSADAGKETLAMSYEEAFFETVTNKLESVLNRTERRLNEVEAAIDRGAVAGAVSGVLESKFREEYPDESDEDDFETVWDGVTVSIENSYKSMNLADKRGRALVLLSTYSELYNQNPTRLESGGLLNWLGRKGDDSLQFTCGPCTFTARAWTGTYMPEYLLLQEQADKRAGIDRGDYYKSKQCSLLDMLLYVSAGDAENTPIQTYEVTEIREEEEDVIGHRSYEVEGPVDGLNLVGDNTYIVTEEFHYTRTVQKTYTVIHGFALYPVSIGVRNIGELSDVIGLWAGDPDGDGRSSVRQAANAAGAVVLGTSSDFYFQCENPDPLYRGHTVTDLTPSQINKIKNTIYGEFGNDLGGAIIVAQSIRDNVDRQGSSYDSFMTDFGYSGYRASRTASEYNTAIVNAAFEYVFTRGNSGVQSAVWCMYCQPTIPNDAEYQKLFTLPLVFVIQVKNVRFFKW